MGKAIAKTLSRDSSIKIFTIDIDKKDISGIQKIRLYNIVGETARCAGGNQAIEKLQNK